MIDNFLETILEILKQPKDNIRIEIRNFGVFNISLSKKRTNARNPKTKELVVIPERKKLTFKPSKKIKEYLKDLHSLLYRSKPEPEDWLQFLLFY